ncbi:hypothetical protein [Streptomyces sp. NPDC002671]
MVSTSRAPLPSVLVLSLGGTIAMSAPGDGHSGVAPRLAAADSSGALLGAAAGLVAGLVVAAFGAGHAPKTWAEPLGDLAARTPVVLTSRTGAGSILTHTYNFGPGTDTDLLERGLINGGSLTPRKARLLLLALLRSGAELREIRAAFELRRR